MITQYNMAVFYFAQERAINFARQSRAQAFWIQAADSPPNWFCNGYSATQLEDLKRKWLAYHARKTEGVLSLLLCCHNMPFVVKHSGGPEFKKYGVHNGSRCRLKAWKLQSRTKTKKAWKWAEILNARSVAEPAGKQSKGSGSRRRQ